MKRKNIFVVSQIIHASMVREKSNVVGIKLTTHEYIVWDAYREEKNQCFAELIHQAVENYIILKIIDSLPDATFFSDLQEKLQHLTPGGDLRTVTFRVKELTLNKWDHYAKVRFISRTALIKQAVNAFFNPTLDRFLKTEDPLSQRLKRILLNTIVRIGIVNFNELAEIFENVNPRLLNDMLDSLEGEGSIGRKGFETYVPTDPRAVNLDTRLVAGNLGRIIENLHNNREDLEDPTHLSLTQAAFEYLETIITSFTDRKTQKEIAKILSLKKNLHKEIMKLFHPPITSRSGKRKNS